MARGLFSQESSKKTFWQEGLPKSQFGLIVWGWIFAPAGSPVSG
jgi:hypothetical protein